MRVGDVLTTDVGKEIIAALQVRHLLLAGMADMHVNPPIKYCKDLLPIVAMPVVRLVGPMQAYGDTFHMGNVERVPCELAARVEYAQAAM